MEQDTMHDMLLNNYTTKTRIIVAELIRSNRRYQDVSTEVRAIREMLAQNARLSAQIREETKIIPGFVKSLKNIFSFGESEMGRHEKKK